MYHKHPHNYVQERFILALKHVVTKALYSDGYAFLLHKIREGDV